MTYETQKPYKLWHVIVPSAAGGNVSLLSPLPSVPPASLATLQFLTPGRHIPSRRSWHQQVPAPKMLLPHVPGVPTLLPHSIFGHMVPPRWFQIPNCKIQPATHSHSTLLHPALSYDDFILHSMDHFLTYHVRLPLHMKLLVCCLSPHTRK